MRASTTILASWPQFGFDPCHTGYNPNEHILSPSNVGGLGEAWEFTTGGFLESQPAVAYGLVYFTSNDGYVYAVSATTGTMAWRYSIGGPNLPTSPAIVNGVLFVGSYGNYGMYALNASTGALLWKYPTSQGVLAPPTVVNGVVYFGANDDYVYALNASTGALLWKYQTGGTATSPAVANGTVYVQSGDLYLYALDANTGSLLWKFMDGFSDKYPAPAVANGLVYVSATGTNHLFALDATAGTVVWSSQFGGSTPAVANGLLYVSDPIGHLYALSPRPEYCNGSSRIALSPSPQLQ